MLVTKVRSDLTIAQGYFERVSEGIGRSVSSLADSERLANVLRRPENGTNGQTADLLGNLKDEFRLDFLHYFPVGPKPGGLPDWSVIQAAMAGSASVETDEAAQHQPFAELVEQDNQPGQPIPMRR